MSPDDEPGVRDLVKGVLRQETLCGRPEDCTDPFYRCRVCGHSQSEEMDQCPRCGAGWKQMDVSHGPNCPKNLLTDALETGLGILVRRCFRLLALKEDVGITIMLADVTEEELQVMEVIVAERARKDGEDDAGAQSFQELLIRKLSRR